MIRKIFAIVMAVVVFGGILTFMLWINDWGQSVPNDLVQMLWAFNFVTWPILTYHILKSK